MRTEVPVKIADNTRKFLGEIHGILDITILHLLYEYHFRPVVHCLTYKRLKLRFQGCTVIRKLNDALYQVFCDDALYQELSSALL